MKTVSSGQQRPSPAGSQAAGIGVTLRASPADAEGRLRDIQAITDVGLSRMEDHDLLAELLRRARDILRADTAAVLLLDSSARELVAAS